MGNCCLIGCLSGVREDELVRASYATNDPKCIYRDDLNEKPSPSKEGRGGRNRGDGSQGVRRVKILLTRQEAALLLSNCKVDEGLLECKLSQLPKIETTTTCTPLPPPPATLLFPTSLVCHDSWKPALESISEEL